MALVTLPYTLVANTAENVNNLNSNLTALRDGINIIDTAQLNAGSVTYAKLASDITDLIAPVGTIMDYTGTADPVANKWVLCDGRAISRTTYATLFSVFGGLSTPYGTGDGVTTFNIPDLRGRVAMGADTMNTAANRVTSNGARGNTGGVNTYTLGVNDIPAHTHTYSNSISVSGTTSGDSWANGGSGIAQAQAADYTVYFYAYINSQYNATYTPVGMTYKPHTHTVTSTGTSSGTTAANTTSGNTLDNKQLYQVTTKIIRIA